MENKSSTECGIGYEMEELIPLVARLAEKYTGFESSSVTYERAQQLMEAVIYCIKEYREVEGEDRKIGDGIEGQGIGTDQAVLKNRNDIIKKEEQRISASDAYQRGYELVVQKARAANEQYHKIMENFCDYGSRALYETIVVGMPAFFLHYDARFAPQEEILWLDYPIPAALANLRGIDRIYQYLCYIQKEQEFLGRFPKGYVQEVCTAYHKDYGELFINLSEIMYEELNK
ncbi:MAG: hypothetical protein K2N63_07540 [Lachnospiraceae bacterium]|nr:hypothetical protein [Lachnospiraceae bacterium]